MDREEDDIMSQGDFITQPPREEEPASAFCSEKFGKTLPVTVLGRYEVIQKIGTGGMGDVYLAIDQELNRQVAMKRIRAEASESQQAIQRFYQEAKAAAALNHSNIVQIFDRNKDDYGEFIVMEYVEGESLGQRLKQGALDLDESVRITLALCNALQAAHDVGILHRDVKPANILLDLHGVPKLADFGVARLGIDSEMTMAGSTVGTLAYMAPEQEHDSTTVSQQADQYSLAATLYHMLTGEVPTGILERRLPDVLRDLMVRATEPEPSSRYATMADFRQAIINAVEESVIDSISGEQATGNTVETFLKQKQRIEKIHHSARRLAFEQHDYPLARTTLKQVPASARDEQLWQEINEKAEQIESLNQSIASAVEKIEWKGLNPAVDILLELQPNREDLRELRKHLPEKDIVTKEELQNLEKSALLQVLSENHPGIKWLKTELESKQLEQILKKRVQHLLSLNSLALREEMLEPLTLLPQFG